MNKHKEGQTCECEICRDGIDAVLAKEQAMIDKHGWFAHFVGCSSEHPYGMNIHTHGLAETQHHTDLQICMSMPAEVAHSILVNCIENHIKKGEKFEPGKKYENLIGAGYKILFLEAIENERMVLRLILPDKNGGYDGEMSKQLEGCIIPDGLKLSA